MKYHMNISKVGPVRITSILVVIMTSNKFDLLPILCKRLGISYIHWYWYYADKWSTTVSTFDALAHQQRPFHSTSICYSYGDYELNWNINCISGIIASNPSPQIIPID